MVKRLSAKLEQLEARKPKTSRTSSKPPSSEPPWATRHPKRKRSGKKQGAQPRHKGKGRDIVPPGDVDEVRSVRPESCDACHAPLSGDDPSPRRHQVVDIPPVNPTVLEVRLHALECAACGTVTKASLPDDVHASSFGPNLSALIVLLTGEYRMSRRNVRRFIQDTYSIDISLGAISNIEKRISEGLAAAHGEAMAEVAGSATKYVDETPWLQRGALAWMWVAVGALATVFVIRDSRKREVAVELLGEDPTGVVVTDRYAGYLFVAMDRHQVCLAHLMRDFLSMADGEAEHRWIGERLHGLLGAVFRVWHQFKDGEIDRARLQRWCRPLRARMLELLDQGALSSGYQTPGMCRGILRTEPAMWTFLHHEGVEPTNNTGERAVRPSVLLRKSSLGTQSERGSRYVERMQTAAATLKRAGRSVSDFVIDVSHSVLCGGAAPALLP